MQRRHVGESRPGESRNGSRDRNSDDLVVERKKNKRHSRSHHSKLLLGAFVGSVLLICGMIASVLTSHSDPQEYHVIFSTGCSRSQDWQSYVFFYHAQKSGQLGTITRIASGCTHQQKRDLTSYHNQKIRTISPRFKIHFTPDYSNVRKDADYKYFNKPFGVKHWMLRVAFVLLCPQQYR